MGFGGIGPMEMMIVAIIGLLLFGKRLPEVARNMGKGFSEFRKGMSGIESEVRNSMYSSSSSSSSYHEPERTRPVPAEEREELTAPKFEPPSSAPREAETEEQKA